MFYCLARLSSHIFAAELVMEIYQRLPCLSLISHTQTRAQNEDGADSQPIYFKYIDSEADLTNKGAKLRSSRENYLYPKSLK